MSTLSDALAGRIQEELDRDKPRKVFSILANDYVDAAPPSRSTSRSRGSFDATILDRDSEGKMARMRIASLGGDVEYDVLATHRDSQGRLVQLRITLI